MSAQEEQVKMRPARPRDHAIGAEIAGEGATDARAVAILGGLRLHALGAIGKRRSTTGTTAQVAATLTRAAVIAGREATAGTVRGHTGDIARKEREAPHHTTGRTHISDHPLAGSKIFFISSKTQIQSNKRNMLRLSLNLKYK